MNIKQFSLTSVLLTGTLLISSLTQSVNAKDIAIYRWVDNNNVVHFSQNLPQNGEYKELSTISSYKALSKTERKALAQEADAEQIVEDRNKKEEAINAKNKATFEKNCQAARLNIKMLNSSDNIQISEENKDGSIGSRSLTLDEREEKMVLSKKHEELYCSK